MGLTNTARAQQLHIGIFGKRNSGKSSLINAITGQKISVVSDVLGTTTDPVYKTMEIYGIGPCVLIDTAGFDDEGSLGKLRIEKTEVALEKTDVAIIVCSDGDISCEIEWIEKLREKNTPYIVVLNKIDSLENPIQISQKIEKMIKEKPLMISLLSQDGVDQIIPSIIRKLPEDFEAIDIVGDLVEDGDVVLLVMPQDIQAPKGRLILPQVQTLRELLDKKCIVLSCTTDRLEQSLSALLAPPKLIITDSQVFRTVYDKLPKDSMITSFSVLFAKYKGDINYYMESVKAIDSLTVDSRILIAEACTHAPLSEDIGRVKIPRMLRNKIGEELTIDIVSGIDFPEDLSSYSLVIQCGGCMFNRKYVLNRIEKAKKSGVPMTNYGIVLAYLSNILDEVVI